MYHIHRYLLRSNMASAAEWLPKAPTTGSEQESVRPKAYDLLDEKTITQPPDDPDGTVRRRFYRI